MYFIYLFINILFTNPHIVEWIIKNAISQVKFMVNFLSYYEDFNLRMYSEYEF